MAVVGGPREAINEITRLLREHCPGSDAFREQADAEWPALFGPAPMSTEDVIRLAKGLHGGPLR